MTAHSERRYGIMKIHNDDFYHYFCTFYCHCTPLWLVLVLKTQTILFFPSTMEPKNTFRIQQFQLKSSLIWAHFTHTHTHLNLVILTWLCLRSSHELKFIACVFWDLNFVLLMCQPTHSQTLNWTIFSVLFCFVFLLWTFDTNATKPTCIIKVEYNSWETDLFIKITIQFGKS